MHGASKIILAKSNFQKISWLIIIICAWAMFVFQVYCVCLNYFSYPKKIHVEIAYGEVPFPAITICNTRGLDFYYLYQSAVHSKELSDYILSEWTRIVHNRTDFNSSQSIELLAEIYSAIQHNDFRDDSDLRQLFSFLQTNTRKYLITAFDTESVAITREEFIATCRYSGRECMAEEWLQFKHEYYIRCFTYTPNNSQLKQGVDHGWSSVLMTGNGMLHSEGDMFPVAIHGLYDRENAFAGKAGVRVVLHPPGTRPLADQ